MNIKLLWLTMYSHKIKHYECNSIMIIMIMIVVIKINLMTKLKKQNINKGNIHILEKVSK